MVILSAEDFFMDRNQLPIGVFDSGVGGLTVVRELMKNLPGERIIYYGDTARVPYGNKSPETIIRYSRQIARFLLSQDVKAIVIACNTASALALAAVQEELSIPVIGVVEPGASAAVRVTRSGHIGVIGTRGTVSSGLYGRFISQIRPGTNVIAKACPLFVNLVEEGMLDTPITTDVIHYYLDAMVNVDLIDTLILGCTHYPLLAPLIEREYRNLPGGRITLVNPAYETALALKELLAEEGLSSEEAEVLPTEHRYYASDDAEGFRTFAENILGIEVPDVKIKVLE